MDKQINVSVRVYRLSKLFLIVLFAKFAGKCF